MSISAPNAVVDLHSRKPGGNRATGPAQPNARKIPGVKQVIAVASGKGGVGKSTTATNLALALQADGARVGMLDADLYGPSQPRILGLKGQPEVPEDGGLEPLTGYGIQTMSIGFLVDEESPVIWRGPMITQALTRLAFETRWQDLDYLIIDLPPGTAAVIVTTPQDIALLDARKGLEMFRKANIPVLGIIENMSTHICSECGHEEAIFGHGGASRMARNADCPLLGELPLDIRIRAGADAGVPVVVSDPSGSLSQAYGGIVHSITTGLASLRELQDSGVPEVIIE